MRTLVLVRIDDRLIHGQVVTQWVKSTHGNIILIIEDTLVKNIMMTRVLKAAAPPDVGVKVNTVTDAITFLLQESEKNENIIVLVKTPDVIESLIDNGIEIPKVILGGMGLSEGRKRFNRNVAANEEELLCMKRIIQKGTEIFYQLVPSQRAVNVEKFF